MIRRAIDDLDVYLRRKVDEIHTVRMLLAAVPGEYNHRQLALLEGALGNPDVVFTVQSHARSHNVSDETARHDLLQLSDRGLLERVKRGKKYVWLPQDQLATRLRGPHLTPPGAQDSRVR